METQSIPLKT